MISVLKIRNLFMHLPSSLSFIRASRPQSPPPKYAHPENTHFQVDTQNYTVSGDEYLHFLRDAGARFASKKMETVPDGWGEVQREIPEDDPRYRTAEWALDQSLRILLAKPQKDFEKLKNSKSPEKIIDFLQKNPYFKISEQDNPDLDLAKRLSIPENVRCFSKDLLQQIRLAHHRQAHTR